MSYLYLSINIVSMFMLFIIILVTLKNKRKKGAIQLIILLIFTEIWSFGSFMELGVSTYAQKLFWRNITQIGVFLVPVSSVYFSIKYTEDDKPLYNKIIITSVFINIISILLIMTNSQHHLMRELVYLKQNNLTTVLYVKQTMLGKILVSFTFVLSLISILKIWIFMRTTSKHMKSQVSMILIGILLPTIFAWTKNAWLQYLGVTIPISTSFLFSAIFIFWGVFRYNFMSISPIAIDWAIDAIDEGIIICSLDGQVVDINQSTINFIQNYNKIANENTPINNKTICKYDYIKQINSIIHNCFEEWSNAIENFIDESVEITLDIVDYKKYYNINVHVLKNLKKSKLGTVSVVRDITEEKVQNKLLRQMAEIDGLTQILNRKTYVRLVNNRINDFEETNSNAYMLVLDVDHFKNLNDTYGHIVGDKVLQGIVRLIKSCLKDTSLFGRVGGEEFSIFLTDCDENSCLEICERIRMTLQNYSFEFDNEKINATICIGAASSSNITNINFTNFFEKADNALYKAKNSGRNRTVFFR